DLAGYWPRSELPFGFMTSMNNGGIPNHGFTHWWTMFNPRQLLVQCQLLRAIAKAQHCEWTVREFVLRAFQQYLRNQNLFCIWNVAADKMEPMFSNNNYHPKSTMVENCVFADLGRGNWASATENILEALRWTTCPWETVAVVEIEKVAASVAEE